MTNLAAATPLVVSARAPIRPIALTAWGLCALFYFYQYAVRSAPSVMVPEIADAYGLSALGVGSLIGLYYYAYAPMNLIAGAALDRYGAKRTIPIGVFICGIGVFLFGFGEIASASLGRLLQGAGSAFAFVGTVYVATNHIQARYLVLLIGVTQMFGMLGGSAGQAPVSHLLEGYGLHWQDFWIYAGVLGCILAIFLVLMLPSETSRSSVRADVRTQSRGSMFSTYRVVFSNPQSWFCGLTAGLLFIPTTIGAMIWGVSFLSNGYGMEPAHAADIVALVPLGWVIGCPILGLIAVRTGRRKPVLIGGGLVALGAQLVILYVDMSAVPSSLWLSAFLLLGVASGAAMIPYTIIKEANPEEVKGSATGALNFINFGCSALLAPVFGWLLLSVSGVFQPESLLLADFRLGLAPIPMGILAAIVIAMCIKETGPSVS